MSARLMNKLVQYFGPYPYTRHALPSPGSQNLTFLQNAQQQYNPIGAGWAVQGEPTWNQTDLAPDFYYPKQVQILTLGNMNLPQLVGVVGPGGVPHGQVFNAPLLDTGNYQ